ncbi:MAG: Gfo/Idh/MocA family oxidoreductase [Halioglobus sp.]|nr:Gfo/Idh/MocA family oxidoreductase [Halioglobus sp.]
MGFKVVVIGTGFGRYAMAPSLERLGCEVELVSARDERAIQRAIAARCDLVSIHSPPFLHLAHVSLAARHRRHILCDKPFGCDAGEASEMLALAQSAGVLHFLNFEFRFDAQRQKLKQLLEDGAVGAPLHLSSLMHMSRGRKIPHGWIFEKDKGGGWIGAYASHFVDMLHWLFGDIETHSTQSRIDVKLRRGGAQSSNRMHQATAEDAFTAIFRMRSGVTASLDSSYCAAVDLPAQLTVLGSEGVIQLRTGGDVVLQRANGEPERFATASEHPMNAALNRWLAAVLDAIGNNRPITPDFAAGLKCAEVLDSMRSSRPW